MTKMYSIRLDFPAKYAEGLTKPQILRLLSATLDTGAAAKKLGYERATLTAMSLCESEVNEYDDKHGGPVFYIP